MLRQRARHPLRCGCSEARGHGRRGWWRACGPDPIAILIKELRVLGSFTYADEFVEVIALLADGALQVVDLTSEIARIDHAPAAFERLRDARTMKILIAPNDP
jgi:threonine dehydrogenase-like Zn-dependent dehydrogenase